MSRYCNFAQLYRTEHALGSGTYGPVDIVADISTGCQRVCKRIPKALFGQTLDFDLVRNYLQNLQLLRHPNICSMVDYFEDNEVFYLLYEKHDGGDLAEFIERMTERPNGWANESCVAMYIRQMLIALCYCHTSKIYHLDLKPSNVAFTSRQQDAVVKIQDFGLCKIFDPECSIARSKPTHLMPPEKFSAEPNLNEKTDMYTIGVLAYFLLVNKPAFPERQPQELMQSIRSGKLKFMVEEKNKII